MQTFTRSRAPAACAAFALAIVATVYFIPQLAPASVAEYSTLMSDQDDDDMQDLADMAVQDWVDVFKVLGYAETQKVSKSALLLKIPDS